MASVPLCLIFFVSRSVLAVVGVGRRRQTLGRGTLIPRTLASLSTAMLPLILKLGWICLDARFVTAVVSTFGLRLNFSGRLSPLFGAALLDLVVVWATFQNTFLFGEVFCLMGSSHVKATTRVQRLRRC